eukprot:g20689.t1
MGRGLSSLPGWRASVAEDGRRLQFAPEHVRGDRRSVLLAVKQDGEALDFASEALRADRGVVWAAVTSAGRALRFAAEEALEGTEGTEESSLAETGTSRGDGGREVPREAPRRWKERASSVAPIGPETYWNTGRSFFQSSVQHCSKCPRWSEAPRRFHRSTSTPGPGNYELKRDIHTCSVGSFSRAARFRPPREPDLLGRSDGRRRASKSSARLGAPPHDPQDHAAVAARSQGVARPGLLLEHHEGATDWMHPGEERLQVWRGSQRSRATRAIKVNMVRSHLLGGLLLLSLASLDLKRSETFLTWPMRGKAVGFESGFHRASGMARRVELERLEFNSAMIFTFNFLAIVPLAGILGAATESMASHTGEMIGGPGLRVSGERLLNATFGNAVEMIMCMQAVKAGLVEVVQGNLLGSVLSNLLLVLGMAIFCAGLKYNNRQFNAIGAAANMSCLVVASISICLPTLFGQIADTGDEVLMISRLCSLFLSLVYFLFLYFQLGTHAYLFVDGEDGEAEEEVHLSVAGSASLLILCTLVVAGCSENLVDSIEGVSTKFGLPKAGNQVQNGPEAASLLRGLRRPEGLKMTARSAQWGTKVKRMAPTKVRGGSTSW